MAQRGRPVVVTSAVRGSGSDASRQGVRSWKLWSLPRNALAFILTVELLAVGLTAVAVANAHPTKTDVARFALLAVLSVLLPGLLSPPQRPHPPLAPRPA